MDEAMGSLPDIHGTAVISNQRRVSSCLSIVFQAGVDQNHESRVEITNQNTQNHNYSKARQLN